MRPIRYSIILLPLIVVVFFVSLAQASDAPLDPPGYEGYRYWGTELMGRRERRHYGCVKCLSDSYYTLGLRDYLGEECPVKDLLPYTLKAEPGWELAIVQCKKCMEMVREYWKKTKRATCRDLCHSDPETKGDSLQIRLLKKNIWPCGSEIVLLAYERGRWVEYIKSIEFERI